MSAFENPAIEFMHWVDQADESSRRNIFQILDAFVRLVDKSGRFPPVKFFDFDQQLLAPAYRIRTYLGTIPTSSLLQTVEMLAPLRPPPITTPARTIINPPDCTTNTAINPLQRRQAASRSAASRNTVSRNTAGKNTAGKNTAGKNAAGPSIAGPSIAGPSNAGANAAGSNAAGSGLINPMGRDVAQIKTLLKDRDHVYKGEISNYNDYMAVKKHYLSVNDKRGRTAVRESMDFPESISAQKVLIRELFDAMLDFKLVVDEKRLKRAKKRKAYEIDDDEDGEGEGNGAGPASTFTDGTHVRRVKLASNLEIEMLCWELLYATRDAQNGRVRMPPWVTEWSYDVFGNFTDRFQEVKYSCRHAKSVVNGLMTGGLVHRLAAAPKTEYKKKIQNRDVNRTRDCQVKAGIVAMKDGKIEVNEDLSLQDESGKTIAVGHPGSEHFNHERNQVVRRGFERDTERVLRRAVSQGPPAASEASPATNNASPAATADSPSAAFDNVNYSPPAESPPAEGTADDNAAAGPSDQVEGAQNSGQQNVPGLNLGQFGFPWQANTSAANPAADGQTTNWGALGTGVMGTGARYGEPMPPVTGQQPLGQGPLSSIQASDLLNIDVGDMNWATDGSLGDNNLGNNNLGGAFNNLVGANNTNLGALGNGINLQSPFNPNANFTEMLAQIGNPGPSNGMGLSNFNHQGPYTGNLDMFNNINNPNATYNVLGPHDGNLDTLNMDPSPQTSPKNLEAQTGGLQAPNNINLSNFSADNFNFSNFDRLNNNSGLDSNYDFGLGNNLGQDNNFGIDDEFFKFKFGEPDQES